VCHPLEAVAFRRLEEALHRRRQGGWLFFILSRSSASRSMIFAAMESFHKSDNLYLIQLAAMIRVVNSTLLD
jgi:hypothetical protein